MKLNSKTSWGLVLIWMIVIFVFSAMPDTHSSESSMLIVRIVLKVLSTFGLDVNIDFMHLLVRKSAHAAEYFVLSLLCIHAFQKSEFALGKSVLCGFLLSVGYACTDEFHQLFVPGRCGQITDVLIDSAGSAVAAAFYSFTKHYQANIIER